MSSDPEAESSDEEAESNTVLLIQTTTDDDLVDEDASAEPVIIVEQVSVELRPDCEDDDEDVQPEPAHMNHAPVAIPIEQLLAAPFNVNEKKPSLGKWKTLQSMFIKFTVFPSFARTQLYVKVARNCRDFSKIFVIFMRFLILKDL